MITIRIARSRATFQTLPGASFVVNGAAQAADSALITASAEMKWLNGWSAAATFEGEFSNVTRATPARAWYGTSGSWDFRFWRAPCKGGAFQWVQAPPGNRSSRKQSEQSWR